MLPILAIVLAGLIWLVVGRAMKPVEVVRRSVAEISAKNLDERVPSPKSGDELDCLVGTMNLMLQGLHRRPLRGSVGSSWTPAMSCAVRSRRSGVRSRPVAMKLSTGSQHSHRMALAACCCSAWTSWPRAYWFLIPSPVTAIGHRAAPSTLTSWSCRRWRSSGKPHPSPSMHRRCWGGQVLAREVDMMRIIENLSSNAVRHAESRIEYTVTEPDDQVWLAVADDGPGIPEAMRGQMVLRAFCPDRQHEKPGQRGDGTRIGYRVRGRKRLWGRRLDRSRRRPRARFVVRLPASTENRRLHLVRAACHRLPYESDQSSFSRGVGVYSIGQ